MFRTGPFLNIRQQTVYIEEKKLFEFILLSCEHIDSPNNVFKTYNGIRKISVRCINSRKEKIPLFSAFGT